jgi:hypothetical protein
MLGYLDAGRNFNQYAADVKPSLFFGDQGFDLNTLEQRVRAPDQVFNFGVNFHIRNLLFGPLTGFLTTGIMIYR